MDREVNTNTIPTLEEQTAQKGAEDFQPDCSQYSLSNVACVPPEVLGYIFQMVVDPVLPPSGDTRFSGIQAGPYNFFLVCRRRCQVARSTPELWSPWGNNFGDWKRRCLSSAPSPLDLVLDWDGDYP